MFNKRLSRATKKIGKTLVGFFACLAFAQTAFAAAYYNMMAFWQAPYMIFSSSAQTLYPDVCSTAITIQYTVGGKAERPNATIPVNVSVSGTAGVALYTDASCSTPLGPTVNFTTSRTVTYVFAQATTTGTYTVQASALNFKPISQSATAVANPYIWTGAAGDGNWLTGANWSGGSRPTNTKVAYFDGSCTSCNANITASTSVAGVKIKSTYTGTITQNAGATLTVSTNGWQQAGGTFIGSSAGDDLQVSWTGAGGGNPFIVSGGTFKASSGTTTVGGSIVDFTGGTFNNNNGTLYLAATTTSGTFDPGTATFKNFTIGNGYWDFASTIKVTGDLALSNTGSIRSLDGSSVQVAGNVTFGSGSGYQGTSTIELNGSTNQTIDATGAGTASVPNLKISSTGGTVSLVGSITVQDDYTVASGTINAGTSTLILKPGTHTFLGSSYNNVTFNTAQGTVTLNDALNVNGTLTLSSTNVYNSTISGTINAKGSVIVLNHGMYSSGAASPTLNIVGSANQTIDCSAGTASYSGYWRPLLPGVKIASTGGTVSFVGNCSINNIFEYASGTVNFGTTQTQIFFGSSGSLKSAGMSFHDLAVYAASSVSNLSVQNNLSVTGALQVYTDGHTTNINMPNPGSGYSLTVGGTLTNNTPAVINMNGATLSYGTLVNTGTINP